MTGTPSAIGASSSSSASPLTSRALAEDQRGVGAVAADQPGRALQPGQLGARRGAEQRQRRGCGRAPRPRPAWATAASTASSAIWRYVVSLPPTTVTTPVRRGEHGVPAGEVGGGARAVGSEVSSSGRRPAYAPTTSERRSVVGERGGDDVEEEADLGLGRLGHVGDLALDGLVGEADVEGAVGLGEHHDEPVGRARARARSPRPGGRAGCRRGARGGCRATGAG